MPDIGNTKEEVKWIWKEKFENAFPDQGNEYMEERLRQISSGLGITGLSRDVSWGLWFAHPDDPLQGGYLSKRGNSRLRQRQKVIVPINPASCQNTICRKLR